MFIFHFESSSFIFMFFLCSRWMLARYYGGGRCWQSTLMAWQFYLDGSAEVVYIQASLPSMLWSVPVISVTGVTWWFLKIFWAKAGQTYRKYGLILCWNPAIASEQRMKRSWDGLSIRSELYLPLKSAGNNNSLHCLGGGPVSRKNRSGVKCWNDLKCLPRSHCFRPFLGVISFITGSGPTLDGLQSWDHSPRQSWWPASPLLRVETRILSEWKLYGQVPV